MNLSRILFSFQGRIRRTTYWLAGIGVSMVFFVTWGVLAIASGAVAKGLAGLASPQFLALIAAFLWIHLAIAAKRCHDRGYSALMTLLLFVPVIGGLWALIDLGFIPGTLDRNKYGLSPKTSSLAVSAAA
jgi:uncharacterized membrane protein YhaH (DUF805 family)